MATIVGKCKLCEETVYDFQYIAHAGCLTNEFVALHESLKRIKALFPGCLDVAAYEAIAKANTLRV